MAIITIHIADVRDGTTGFGCIRRARIYRREEVTSTLFDLDGAGMAARCSGGSGFHGAGCDHSKRKCRKSRERQTAERIRRVTKNHSCARSAVFCSCRR